MLLSTCLLRRLTAYQLIQHAISVRWTSLLQKKVCMNAMFGPADFTSKGDLAQNWFAPPGNTVWTHSHFIALMMGKISGLWNVCYSSILQVSFCSTESWVIKYVVFIIFVPIMTNEKFQSILYYFTYVSCLHGRMRVNEMFMKSII